MFNCVGSPAPQAALFLAAEDSLGGTIKPRLVAAGAATKRVRALNTRSESFRLPTDTARLETEVAKHRIRLIVVDPLVPFVEGTVNSDRSIRLALMPLAQLARRTGAAVVVVHHLNKSGGTSALYRAAGTIGLIGLVRSALYAGDLPGSDGKRVLAQIKSNCGPPATSLAYEFRERFGVTTIDWIGESEYSADDLCSFTGRDQNSALTEAAHVIFSILGEGRVEAKSVIRLASEAGVSAATLKRAKKALGVISFREGFGPGSKFFWRLDADNLLSRQLMAKERDALADRLFSGTDDEDDPDSADWWKSS